MLSQSQLSEIRVAMEAEHRKDREALERLTRFLPTVDQTTSTTPTKAIRSEQSREIAAAIEDGTVIGQIEYLFRSAPGRTWSAPQLNEELRNSGAALRAKHPINTISVALKKLSDRRKISLVSRGSGREPNRYQLFAADGAELSESEMKEFFKTDRK